MAPTKLSLLGGAYRARSLKANAQRCVNLYPEKNPPNSQASSPFTHYPRPGYSLLAAASAAGNGRGLYRASNNDLFKVVGTNVYFVDQNWTETLLGIIAFGHSVVSMADNGTDILMVDGTSAGYSINLASHVMAAIIDPAFYGADMVKYVGSCFVLNRPGTPQFYISGPNALTFDPLDFGQKTASADPIVALVALNNQVWLLGSLKGEVWYFSGAADFPFQILPGVLIDHGTAAKYSAAPTDKFSFWLTQDTDGPPWVAQGGADYSVKRVSTHAIENEIQGYRVWNDAIGYTAQQLGHTWFVVSFPSADKTWVYDLATQLWHERASIDQNGVLHRDRGQLQTFAYNVNVAVDWQTGDLLQSSPKVYKDKDRVFPCIRSFPHAVDTMERISYRSLTADMEVGNQNGDPVSDNKIYLRQSTDGGVTFRNARSKSFGAVGKFKTLIRYWRLDLARDCVFELSWGADVQTALCDVYPDPSDAAET